MIKNKYKVIKSGPKGPTVQGTPIPIDPRPKGKHHEPKVKKADCTERKVAPKKIKVERADKDVLAAGSRYGYNSELSRFGVAPLVSGVKKGSSPKKIDGTPKRKQRTAESMTQVDAVALALAEALGEVPAPRPGLGQQPVRSAEDDAAGIAELIRVVRTVQ